MKGFILPYWVINLSTNSAEQGLTLIIRRNAGIPSGMVTSSMVYHPERSQFIAKISKNITKKNQKKTNFAAQTDNLTRTAAILLKYINSSW